MFGSPVAFTAAVVLVAAWLTGLPFFGISNQLYQLLINTTTTIVTFIMVFAIQHTTNRENEAMMLKLDALVEASAKATNTLLNIEEMSDEEVKEYREQALLKGRAARQTSPTKKRRKS